MKNGKRHGIFRKVCALASAAVLSLSLAACGNSSGDGAQAKEWIWVPEFITVDEENVSYYDMQLVGDALYSTSYIYDEAAGTGYNSICRYSLTDRNMTSVPLSWSGEEENWNLNRGSFTEDGSMYGIVNAYNEDYTESTTYLCKFGADGKQVFCKDVTDLMADSYPEMVALDGQGRIYVSADTNVLLFDGEGNSQGKVSLDAGGNGWIRSIGSDKSGKMYVCYYNNDGYDLAEIDFDGKKLGANYDNFNGGNGSGKLGPRIDKDFIIQDGNKVYEYDLKTQKQEELFSWIDSDINGNYVQTFGMLEDGRFLAVTMDWESNDNGIALLTKTRASEVPQKETIVLASLYGGYDVQSVAVKFNKANEKYRISIKTYVDYNSWDGDDYEAMWADALNRLNNDITSSNCPDILDLSGLNTEQLVAKGVFEDLNGFLEKSDKVKREDFVENVLNSYTFDGKLISIPYSFQLQTVAGKASDVGSEMGWTAEDLIAYADAHPNAQLFDNMSKSQIMMYLMMYNQDAFIDWTAGECNYDSDEFKSLLQFVNRFPDDVDYNSDDASTPSKIQRGQVLLYEMNLHNFEEVQLAEEIFQGDATFIGYPTMDGSAGCMLVASQTFAITSKSGQKDGAWEFIEEFLAQEVDPDRGFSGWGFPTMKSLLNDMAEEAVKIEYWTDENGELYFDENGEPVVMGTGGGFSYQDGWSYEYRKCTQEEVDKVFELIDVAKPVSNSQGDEIMNIINEEAEAFYKGQKSVDEVASIIQSRVKIYIGENK